MCRAYVTRHRLTEALSIVVDRRHVIYCYLDAKVCVCVKSLDVRIQISFDASAAKSFDKNTVQRLFVNTSNYQQYNVYVQIYKVPKGICILVTSHL